MRVIIMTVITSFHTYKLPTGYILAYLTTITRLGRRSNKRYYSSETHTQMTQLMSVNARTTAAAATDAFGLPFSFIIICGFQIAQFHNTTNVN